MGLGPGNHEVRKLQLTGGSTFTVSLPKPWVVKNNLLPRDSIRVDWRPSGALRITPLNVEDHTMSQARFNHETLPQKSLHDHLMGAYISGADLIVVDFSPAHKQKLQAEVRHFLRSTRGFEIIDETEKNIALKCLFKAGDMPLHASLNRMYLQLTSLIRDISSLFEGGDIDFIADAHEREAEVDALLYLIERQARILLDSHLVATRLKLSRVQGLEYANLARALERMMDHAYKISALILEDPDILTHLVGMGPVRQLPEWQSALKELMINIRTRDSERIELARGDLKTLQQTLLEYEHNLMQQHRQNKWMTSSIRMSESVRRLCAYSRDFGEVLLNMMISAEMTRTLEEV